MSQPVMMTDRESGSRIFPAGLDFEPDFPLDNPAPYLHDEEPIQARRPARATVPATELDLYGMFLRDLGRERLLSRDEEIEAGKLVLRGGDEAKKGVEILTRGNIRLVISNARKFQTHPGHQQVPLLDLIQEGCIGLIRAAEKFDWRKGYKFSTYATWWIRQSLSRAIDNTGRTIRLPSHMMDKIRQLKAAQRKLYAELGHAPDEETLTKALGITPAQLQGILRAMRTEAISFDMRVGSDESATLKDFLPDEEPVDPVTEATRQALSRDVDSAMRVLSARERMILTERYGLGAPGKQTQTLDQLGHRLGCTRERVRQLEVRALQKLRDTDSSAHLKAYLE